jgi:hypothetical protein
MPAPTPYQPAPLPEHRYSITPSLDAQDSHLFPYSIDPALGSQTLSVNNFPSAGTDVFDSQQPFMVPRHDDPPPAQISYLSLQPATFPHTLLPPVDPESSDEESRQKSDGSDSSDSSDDEDVIAGPVSGAYLFFLTCIL